LKLTDEERTEWLRLIDYLKAEKLKDPNVSVVCHHEGLCELIESEQAAWQEVERLQVESEKWYQRSLADAAKNDNLRIQLQDALNTLHNLRPYVGVEAWGEALKTANEMIDGCVDRIQEGNGNG